MIAGQEILVTSSSWNQWQTEFATLVSSSDNTLANTTLLTLNQSLSYAHQAKIVNISRSTSPIDLSAEVALTSSNIL